VTAIVLKIPMVAIEAIVTLAGNSLNVQFLQVFTSGHD
jgi:hypothetical protein